MDNCPKCGNGKREFDSANVTMWFCGSEEVADTGQFRQSATCRIRELESEVERLQAGSQMPVLGVEWYESHEFGTCTRIVVPGYVGPCGQGDTVTYHTSARAAVKE